MWLICIHIKSIQCYKCKFCRYNYTVEICSCNYRLSTKRKALYLYLEAASFLFIGRVSGVSNVSVLKLLKVSI